MTTRNFRVHNGISVGDIVISADTNKITGLSTSAPSADGDVANKKYVDDSVSALSSNSIQQGNSNVTVTDAGTGSITVSADGTTRLTVAAAGVTVANALTASNANFPRAARAIPAGTAAFLIAYAAFCPLVSSFLKSLMALSMPFGFHSEMIGRVIAISV